MIVKRCCFVIFVLLFWSKGIAQRIEDQKVEIIQLITSTVSKDEWKIIPSKTLICTTQSISIQELPLETKLESSIDLEMYLMGIAGVRIEKSSYLEVGKIRIRGDSNITLVVDGIKRDVSYLWEIVPENIDQIRILKGASTLFN